MKIVKDHEVILEKILGKDDRIIPAIAYESKMAQLTMKASKCMVRIIRVEEGGGVGKLNSTAGPPAICKIKFFQGFHSLASEV